MDHPGNKIHLCHIADGIGPYNAIAKVAMQGVEIALDAGFQVTVVAKLLHEALRDRVEWLKLYVPPRGFALQWLTGRHFIKKALGGRRFDIVHGHQPQIADLCDVYQCHYLTRAAYELHCLEGRKSLRGRIVRLQEQIVLYAEDRHYRNWNPRTCMLYDSKNTRDDFHRLYGACPLEDVLVYPIPEMPVPTPEQRRQARIKILGNEEKRIVVGYLGGLHERKGYRRLISAIAADEDLFFLLGGQYTEGFACSELNGRYKATGLVKDIDTFYAACDVFAVPSHYEPLGLVAFEAASRGLPVFATAEVGALPHLVEHGAGIQWDPSTPLGAVVKKMMATYEDFRKGGISLIGEFGMPRYAERLLKEYDAVLSRQSQQSGQPKKLIFHQCAI